MGIIAHGNWVADFESLSCWNSANKIILSFEKSGNELKAKIKDIPVNMLEKWIIDPGYINYLKNLVKEAEIFFTRAYFENVVAKNDMQAEY